MKPDNIYLFRHGFSEGNDDKNAYLSKPDYAIDLTPFGIKQSRELGARFANLQSYKIYCSPYFRARRTAEQFLIGGNLYYPYPIYEDPRLREQEWHRCRTEEERKYIELEREQHGSYFFKFPGGESGANVDVRISSFLNTLFRDFDSESYPRNALIFSHGAWSKIFLRRFFHLPFEFIQQVETLPNCGFYHLKLKNGKYIFPTDVGYSPESTYIPFKYEPII